MAQDSTLHIKISRDTVKKLRKLAEHRKQTMGELVRQAVSSCYQLDFMDMPENHKEAVAAYKGGFISIGKLAEIMGMHALDIRTWLRERNIPQNSGYYGSDADNIGIILRTSESLEQYCSPRAWKK